ncbi:uncharacterized protein LOC136031767 [Artemia franciscana]|uniref:uncharacterized protein LOC136031767 n=1 Tax=Artemia franciscana TaxID=6661 RepID=UPI0032DA8D39
MQDGGTENPINRKNRINLTPEQLKELEKVFEETRFPDGETPRRWSKRGKQLYQVNSCRSLTRLPIFIVLARPEAPNSPKHCTDPLTPQRKRIPSGYIYKKSKILWPSWIFYFYIRE